MADEVLTPVATHDALTQAHILAMRQMSDNLGILNRNFERLVDDAKVTRESVVRLEAQDLKATILDVRREAMTAVADLRTEHGGRIDAVEKGVTAGELSMARLRGTIVPLATLGSAILGGVLAFGGELIANLIGQHHP